MRAALANMPEGFWSCRENRHHWFDSNAVEDTRERTIEQIQKCTNCGNERWRLLSKRKQSYGHIVTKWKIRYVEKNYLFKKGVSAELTADDFGEKRMAELGF